MIYALVLFAYIIGGALFLARVKAHSMGIGTLLAWPIVVVLLLIGAFLDWRDGKQ